MYKWFGLVQQSVICKNFTNAYWPSINTTTIWQIYI